MMFPLVKRILGAFFQNPHQTQIPLALETQLLNLIDLISLISGSY